MRRRIQMILLGIINMKSFLIIHLVVWFFVSMFLIAGASVWSGFTKSFVSELPVFLFMSFFELLPISVIIGLIGFFIKRTFSVDIRIKK